MENSIYILSKQDVSISRLHICTWDLIKGNAYIEFGIEIDNPREDTNQYSIILAAPFINKKSIVSSLHERFSDPANSRFIFNDVVSQTQHINGDKRNGSRITFKNRDELTILPAKYNFDESKDILKITIKNIPLHSKLIYSRILIKTNINTLAFVKKGISTKTYIYDFKINERRNLPNNINELITNDNLTPCDIHSTFCFHAVPDNFEISYVDNKKLKNIRKLEVSAFRYYLPEIKSLYQDKYLIIFNKAGGTDKGNSYSFFSSFTKDYMGVGQVILAVGAGLICNLLFAIATLRNTLKSDVSFWKQIPVEYWIAFVIMTLIMIPVLVNWIKKSLK